MPMSPWKKRLRACAIHFVLSLIVATLAALLVFGVWYPYPYRELSGGRELFTLVVLVDVLLGPLITLVIFNATKTHRHLAMDFTVVGLLQIAALAYGLWAVFMARPVHLVFEYSRMTVVHAVDVGPETLLKAPPELAQLPLSGPTLLSLRPLRGAEAIDSVLQATAGISQAAQPALWQSYEIAKEQILLESIPIAQLKMRFVNFVNEIDEAVVRSGRPESMLRSLPLLSRQKAWTVLIDSKTAKPLGFFELDSF